MSEVERHLLSKRISNSKHVSIFWFWHILSTCVDGIFKFWLTNFDFVSSRKAYAFAACFIFELDFRAAACCSVLQYVAEEKWVSWQTDCLPLSEASDSGEPLPALGTANKRVFWHTECLAVLVASNSGEPLPAVFPNSGEPLQSPQSEVTVAIQQHSKATDSDISLFM